MPVSGSAVVKLLPGRKPCRDCGFPTCFAFAMKLASGGTTVDKCPHLSDEAKAQLEELLAPPIRPVTVGMRDNALRVGEEEVMYRHEKTFVHPPGIGLLISDDESEQSVEDKLNKTEQTKFDWIGLTLGPDLLALQNKTGDKENYLRLVNKAHESCSAAAVLISEDLDALFAAREVYGERQPLLYPITPENADNAIPKIQASPTPVAVRADSLEGLVPLTTKLKDAGIEDVVLDPGSRNLMDAIRDQTFIRRASLKQGFRPLGYPTIAFPCFMSEERLSQTLIAATFVDKWAAFIILSDFNPHTLMPLLVHRLNIYTDPRFPLAVEEKYYEVGQPDEKSPVLVTSNWALTYFLVSSAVEATRVPVYVCVKDAEGLGVLTGWAAGKFSGDAIGEFIKKCGIEDKVKTRTLVIPGKVARIKGELEDALDRQWEIVVGPRETTGLGGFLPGFAKKLRQQ